MQVGEEEEEDSDDSDEDDDDGDDGEEMEGPEVVVQDEGPRQTSAEQLAGVRSFPLSIGLFPRNLRGICASRDELKRGLCGQLALAFGDEEDGGTTTAGNSSQTSDGTSLGPSPTTPIHSLS